MKGTFPIHKFRELRTPFYYYDTHVLRDTLLCIRTEAARYGNYSVHYAVKANANPKDPANWPDGVWTLPPALRGAKDEDKPRLQAIGESDRMTLLFRKRA